MIQGEVNDKKGHVEEALEYYMDSADWYKKAYEGIYIRNTWIWFYWVADIHSLDLSHDARGRAFAKNMCLNAVDKAEELKAMTMHQKTQLLST